jgi:multicomponent Na+:H+ antiporter subunit B
MRFAALPLIALLGAFVVWASQDLPHRGDPASPSAVHDSVSVYYIENAYLDARTPNMVTAVLADYRSFDTFGEAIVVVTAAIAALLILVRRREDEEDEGEMDPGLRGPGEPPQPASGRDPGGAP